MLKYISLHWNFNGLLFKPAPPGTDTVDIDVYNAAAKVKGVATEAVVLRIQTDAGGQNLSVIENIFVKNDSKPAMTQFSANPFDFYLPDNAAVAGSAALAPGGMPVQATPVPLADKGHYTFLFPIRPGETRFQISYSVPYTGSYPFAVRLSGPTDTVAVMLPKSMTVSPAAGSPLSPVNDDENAQTLVARNVSSSAPLSFSLSGSGQLPRDSDAPAQPGQAAAPGGSPDTSGPVAATDNKMPGKGLDNPLDPNGTREPWSRYKYWILAGLAFLLAGAAGLLLRKPAAGPGGHPAASTFAAVPHHAVPASAPASAVNHQQQLMQTMKEEMFLLETERLQNHITEAEYSERKAALELILKRALNRNDSGAAS